MPWETYRSSSISRYAAERVIQLIVESATDINAALLAAAGLPAPLDDDSAFIRLPETGLIKVSAAKQMASLAGLRNRLVHDYAEIDSAAIYANIPRILKLFPPYLAAARGRLGLSNA